MVVSTKSDSFGLNGSYVAILKAQWQEDPLSVPEEWRSYFGGPVSVPVIKSDHTPQGAGKSGKKVSSPAAASDDQVEKEALLGIKKVIAENMAQSLAVPTATSIRDVPAKVLDENRRIINDYLEDDARSRCSFTHLIAFAIVQSIKEVDSLNNGFLEEDGKLFKLKRKSINLGLAVDLPGRDGSRVLVVPNIKNCETMNFWEFFSAYNDVIAKAKAQKLMPDDFAGTTITLTNTGGMGTDSSNPRLMQGQGAIFAAGRIGYPAQYESTAPETLKALGIGKILTLTSTYDHRIIQGSESGRFLAHLHELLIGKHKFFRDIFNSLNIPHHCFEQRPDEAIILGQTAQITQTERAMRVSQLIHAYRVRGYELAHSDPLSLAVLRHPELDLENYGLTIWDLDREFDTLGVLPKKRATFRDILRKLRKTYCRRIGVEYMYISDFNQKSWLQHHVESDELEFSKDEKKHILYKLVEAEEFEHFLHKRFVGHKRFSVEGAESVIAMLDGLLDSAASFGVSEAVIGMAHRGRLNVLANTVGKPYEAIFGEFDDIDKKSFQGSGDVKYHLGARGVHRWSGQTKDTREQDQREVRIELACNPSHLEAVGPIVEGQCRAKQDLSGDRKREKIVPIMLHGDGAFAGQGVVYETLQLSGLRGYRTGGTIHIIINNQIGYTTPPDRARSTKYCSDLARGLSLPVFRVNGDDPEACVRAVKMAFEFRMQHKTDVVIDLVCYRRYGHNEGDEPSFTQPIMYKAIRQHASVAIRYSKLLVRRGDLSQEEVDEIKAERQATLDKALTAVRERGHEAITDKHILFPTQLDTVFEEDPNTAVSKETLQHICEKVTYNPEVISVHPRINTQILEKRRQMVLEESLGIDFGMAEILAYGSLLLDGKAVRFSGQDCGRGTFAHRHAVLYDVNDGTPYIPLNHLHKNRDEGEEAWHPSRFRIYDSPLSEAAVLGFEYGYSVTHPSSLVIWEAQFGDFFNGAQIQIDQFLSSSEAKWGQKSRLTLLLPHGYDGQGPEHSSARIERFLQLCAEDNMRLANCSTSAQMFHLLRKQALSPKKPLIIFTHKSLLRAQEAASPLDDFTKGTFQKVIADDEATAKCERLVLCSGKLYWSLKQKREELGDKAGKVALVRVEQLYPFPEKEVEAQIKKLKPKEIVWVQEEPKNSGAFTFVRPCLNDMGHKLRYVGRKPAASPSTGSLKTHKKQQEKIIELAFAAVKASAKDEEV